MAKDDIKKAKAENAERIANIAYSGGGHIGQDDLETAFENGADWRINSVWHTMDEVQDGKRPYIVQYNEECKFAMFTKPIPVPLEQAKSVFKRWAYIKDLIPMED
jgi:hypothetical protein